ncbi:MAG: hypothetical protein AAGF12_05630 [Myxococcota bacterium]
MRIAIGAGIGLTELLADEVAAVVGRRPELEEQRVVVDGSLLELYQLGLAAGLGLTLEVRLAHFRAVRFPQLVRAVREVDWSPWLVDGGRVEVRATARRSRLYHSGAIVERVLRGVGEAVGEEVSPAEGPADLTVHADFVHDRCTLSVDAAGGVLSRRGYRAATGKAPLREDLARALVLFAAPSGAIVDPFCGSGTIPIEAALLRSGRPPNLTRTFAFERFPNFDADEYRRLREALGSREPPAAPTIFASDRDAGAIEATRNNADRAGVTGWLSVECAPLGRAASLTRPEFSVVTNPPHGHRVGNKASLRRLYASFGDRLRSRGPDLLGATLLLRDRRLAKATGLHFGRELATNQGGTNVHFLHAESGTIGEDYAVAW